MGCFPESPLGPASWGSLRESAGLDHWGSDRDRKGGKRLQQPVLRSRQTVFLLATASEERWQLHLSREFGYQFCLIWVSSQWGQAVEPVLQPFLGRKQIYRPAYQLSIATSPAWLGSLATEPGQPGSLTDRPIEAGSQTCIPDQLLSKACGPAQSGSLNNDPGHVLFFFFFSGSWAQIF